MLIHWQMSEWGIGDGKEENIQGTDQKFRLKVQSQDPRTSTGPRSRSLSEVQIKGPIQIHVKVLDPTSKFRYNVQVQGQDQGQGQES